MIDHALPLSSAAMVLGSLALTIARIAGYIDWSWLWITAPIWGGVLAMAALITFLAATTDLR